MNDDDKRVAAVAAAAEVRDDMLVGLGTGSTAAWAIRALGERVAGGLSIRAVATSSASETLARGVGIAVLDFAGVARVDLTIDGVDEITPALAAIKGAGGALVREKIVATASERMIAVADGSKRVAALGMAKLPVETLPFAASFVRDRLDALFATVVVREVDGGRYLTDNGNVIFDCSGSHDMDWGSVAARLSALPGVVGHGLFLTEIDALYVAASGIVTRVERDGPSG